MSNKVLGYRKMMLLNQKEMAEKLNLSEGQYRAKEKGRYEFSQREMKIFYELVKDKVGDVKLEEIFF